MEAVFSMPDKLFWNDVWTITSIVVFTAHQPHNNLQETFLWYFKDDWFENTKIDWRIDKKWKYEKIKNNWLKAFYNNKEVPWLSVLAHLKAEDEWCAEYYLETDYSSIKEDDFIKEMKKYILFKELN